MNLPIDYSTDEVKDPGIHSLPKALPAALEIMLSTCGTQSRTPVVTVGLSLSPFDYFGPPVSEAC